MADETAWERAMQEIETDIISNPKHKKLTGHGGYVEGRMVFEAIQITANSLVETTKTSMLELIRSNQAGAGALVQEIKDLKEASDSTAKRLVNATWGLAGVTLVLAVATIALVLVELNAKH